MGFETIFTEDRDGVRVVTLNRPERLNAWTWQMAAELDTAFRSANADDDVDAIVLTGAGRGFCAGADIEAVFKAGRTARTSLAPRGPATGSTSSGPPSRSSPRSTARPSVSDSPRCSPPTTWSPPRRRSCRCAS